MKCSRAIFITSLIIVSINTANAARYDDSKAGFTASIGSAQIRTNDFKDANAAILGLAYTYYKGLRLQATITSQTDMTSSNTRYHNTSGSFQATSIGLGYEFNDGFYVGGGATQVRIKNLTTTESNSGYTANIGYVASNGFDISIQTQHIDYGSALSLSIGYKFL
ncbi:hypothetical protein ACFOD0_01600 [Shewanella intestini]|uniref:Outer membrane protein beta-barrel domain-containing protein n=1 Tax=Shewanella intestini TaxID=2017544 RepID=A0ABS5I1N9_9GAMM|nr:MULTISPECIES: hypothetical protein [Shewanella]MBR9727265.1 hypothetical protein [Shewanella intestini]MRG36067.1 hypothetical protein [Shewanella sp. XMDDZSB0408]